MPSCPCSIAAIGNAPFVNNFLDNIWVIIALLFGITVFKAIAMTITFSAGGVGGIFIPTLVMGSALGNVVAKIINNLVVVWTSGFPTHSINNNTNSLNLVQDVLSSQLLFECGVAHVYLPGYHVGAQLTLSLPDMKEFVKGRGDIGNYLYELYTNNPLHKQRGVTDQTWRTWVIWDVINIAWMIEPSWVPSHVVSSPVLNNELYWRRDTESYPMREAYGVNRDAIFYDFFKKIDKLK